MITDFAPASMRLLLLKAVQPGHFKHSGKYYLLNGRWHKLHQNAPAPKGAPVAAHPEAAGKHAPAKHFTDEEWKQLELPAENVNAGTYNKQLGKLKEMSEAGHVTGILAHGYGSNTYGKKLATIANHLLALHGSPHKVAAGQKAGEHEAVNQAPLPTKEEADAELSQMVAGTKLPAAAPAAIGDVFELDSQYEKMNAGKWKVYNVSADGELVYMHKVGAKVPNAKNSATIPAATLQEAIAKGTAKKQDAAPAAKGEAISPSATFYHYGSHKDASTLQPLTFFSADKKSAESYEANGKGHLHEVKLSIKNPATADDVVAAAKAVGFGPEDAGMPDEESIAGFEYLSPHLLGMEGAKKVMAKLQAQGFDGAKFATDFDAGGKMMPGGSVVIFDSKQVKVPTVESGPKEGDTKQGAGGTLVFKDGRWHKQEPAPSTPSASIPTNAPAAAPDSQAESVPMLSIMGASMLNPAISAAAFKGDNPIWYSQQNPTYLGLNASSSYMGKEPTEHAKKTLEIVQAAKAAGYAFTGYMKANGGKQGVYLLQKNGKVLTQKGAESLLSASPAKSKAAATPVWPAATEKQKRVVVIKKVSAATPANTADQLGKLQSIPWFKQKLPDENSNAKTHNAAVAKIEAMAFAGDTAGLQAFIDKKAGAKQTYAKKQALLAQTALAALTEGGAAPAKPAEAQAPASPLAGKSAAEVIAQNKGVPTNSLKDAWLAANPGKVGAQAEWAIAATPAPAKKPKVIVRKPAAAPAAKTPLTKKVQAQVFHNTTPGHNKFWSISVNGNQVKTQYGKIGSKGVSTVNGFASPEAAQAAAQKIIATKKKGGYVDAGTMEHSWLAPEAAAAPTANTATVKPMPTKAAAPAAKVPLAVKKLQAIDPTAIAEWLSSGVGKKSDHALSFFDKITKPAQTKFHKWNNASKKYPDHWGNAYQSVAIASLYGQHDKAYIPGTGFVAADNLEIHHAKAASTDPAEIQAAAIALASGKAENGPKDGDTKQGADGMLVFKDGHWHKVDKNTALVDGWKAAIAAGKAPTKEQAEHLDFLMNHPDGDEDLAMETFMDAVHATIDPADFPDDDAFHDAMEAANKKAHALHEQALQTNTTASPQAKVKPAPAAANTGAHPSIDHWVQTGPQGGSNPGGKFKDENGVEWYCKFPADEDTAKSEVLAAKLYAAAGIAGQDAKLVTKGGKLGIASRWVDVKKGANPTALSKAAGVKEGFAVDAWLANWDVVGLGYDNLQIGADGKAVRVDAGGSLQYRAQGGKKAFGHTVTELDSLRDAAINAQSAAVFGKMTKADIAASVAKVLAVPDSTIASLVAQFGPGDAANKQALVEALIARKADLAAKFPNAKKEKKKPVFDPSKVSAPPDFLNWGGSGKSGPSSKEFLNQANHRAAQYIYKAAQTGDVAAVKAIQAPIYDKNSGLVTGKASVLEHPSQHIKGYAQQVINEIHYQMNPPKQFRFDGGHPLHSLNASYPPYVGALQSSAVSKAGKFVVLGDPGTLPLNVLGLEKITHQSGKLTTNTYKAQAQAAISKMPQTQREAVKSYTGAGYQAMNSSLWDGNPTGKAKAAAEALHTLAHDIAPGTVLSRKLKVYDGGLQQILSSTGKVLQEPAIMSTSIRPSSWSGNVQLKLHVGPGVKGLWVGYGSMPGGGAMSVHASEDEMVLPPNTRLLILSVKKASGVDADGFGDGVEHIVEAVILPSEGY